MAENTERRRQKTAERLSFLIESYGIKPADIARRTGICRALISRYLSGRYTPSDRNAEKIAEAFHVSAAWIQGNDGLESMEKLTEIYASLNDEGKTKVLALSEKLRRDERYIAQ